MCPRSSSDLFVAAYGGTVNQFQCVNCLDFEGPKCDLEDVTFRAPNSNSKNLKISRIPFGPPSTLVKRFCSKIVFQNWYLDHFFGTLTWSQTTWSFLQPIKNHCACHMAAQLITPNMDLMCSAVSSCTMLPDCCKVLSLTLLPDNLLSPVQYYTNRIRCSFLVVLS
jgi:hypothetical protein